MLNLYAIISVPSLNVTAISFLLPTVMKSTMLLHSRSSNSARIPSCASSILMKSKSRALCASFAVILSTTAPYFALAAS